MTTMRTIREGSSAIIEQNRVGQAYSAFLAEVNAKVDSVKKAMTAVQDEKNSLLSSDPFNSRLKAVNAELAQLKKELKAAKKAVKKAKKSPEGQRLEKQMQAIAGTITLDICSLTRDLYVVEDEGFDPNSSDDESESQATYAPTKSKSIPTTGSFIPAYRGIHFLKPDEVITPFTFDRATRVSFPFEMAAPGALPTLYSPEFLQKAQITVLDSFKPSAVQNFKIADEVHALDQHLGILSKKEYAEEIQGMAVRKSSSSYMVHASFNLTRALQYGFGDCIAGKGARERRLYPNYNSVGKPAHPYLGAVYIALIPQSEYVLTGAKAILPLVHQGHVRILKMHHPDNEVMFPGQLDSRFTVLIDKLKVPNFSHAYKANYLIKYGFSKSAYESAQLKLLNNPDHPLTLEEKIVKKVLNHKQKQIHTHLAPVALVYPGIEGGFVTHPPKLPRQEKKAGAPKKVKIKKPISKDDDLSDAKPKFIFEAKTEATFVKTEISLFDLVKNVEEVLTTHHHQLKTATLSTEDKLNAQEKAVNHFKKIAAESKDCHIYPLKRSNAEVPLLQALIAAQHTAFQLQWIHQILQELQKKVGPSSNKNLYEKFKVDSQVALLHAFQDRGKSAYLTMNQHVSGLAKLPSADKDYAYVLSQLQSRFASCCHSSYALFTKRILSALNEQLQTIHKMCETLLVAEKSRGTTAILKRLGGDNPQQKHDPVKVDASTLPELLPLKRQRFSAFNNANDEPIKQRKNDPGKNNPLPTFKHPRSE